MAWPSCTAAGVPVIATARSVRSMNWKTDAKAELFFASGSLVVAAMVATALYVKRPGGLAARTTSVNRAVAPAARRGAVAVVAPKPPAAGVAAAQTAGGVNETKLVRPLRPGMVPL